MKLYGVIMLLSYYVVTTNITHHWKFKQPLHTYIPSGDLPHKSTKETLE